MLPDWAGNLHTLMWVTAIAFVIAHLVLWRWRSPRLHFAANYAAIAIGGLSLMSAAFQARGQLAGLRYEVITSRFDAERERIKESVESARHLLCDIRYQRSKDSPSNFDQLIAEQDVGCAAARQLIARSQEWITTTDEPIKVPHMGQEAAKLKSSRDDFEFVYKAVADYNKDAIIRQAYGRQKRTSDWEIPLAVFGPFLAAIAFALALAGITFKPKAASKSTRALADLKPHRDSVPTTGSGDPEK